MDLSWHQPGPSALVDASNQGQSDLCFYGLLKYFANLILFHQGYLFLVPAFPLVSGIWFLMAGLASKDWSKRCIQYLGLFHVQSHWGPCLIHQQAHIFPGLFAAHVLIEALLLAFDIPGQIQLQLHFGFPNCISACSLETVSVFLPGYPFLLPIYIYLIFMSEFCQAFTGHPRTCCDGLLLILEEAILEHQSAFLDIFSLQGLTPWESFKQIFEYSF